MAFLIFPSDILSPLEAVNLMIGSLGEAGVDTLTPPPHQDAQDALAYLSKADLDLQVKGWSWNREHDWPLTLDGDSKAPLPDQTLWAGPAETEWTYRDIVQRGKFLYDREHRTLTFTAAPKVDLIVRQDWDSLPQAARSYIVGKATQIFQATKAGTQIVLQVNASDLKDALVSLEQREDEDAKNNTTYSRTTQSALSGNGGMQRNRRGIL